MNYFYAADNKPLGPVLPEALRALRTQGVIDDTTLIVGEGESSWVPYGERFTQAKEERGRMPTPAKASESPAGAAKDAAPADPAAPVKEKISAVAYQRALAATSRKDEFNTSDAIEFPAVRYNFPPLDQTTPKHCVECFIVVPGHSQVVMQLLIWSRHNQGLVHYDTVKASGGIELECKHLNSKAVHYDSSPSEWQETLNIFIPVALLQKGRKEPLRLQISRPNEGKSFVINVSPDSVAAVLYRLFPDRYVVDSADLEAQRQQRAQSRAVTVGVTIGLTAALGLWIVTPLGFGAACVLGSVLGILSGVGYFRSPLGNPKRETASPVPAG